MHILRLSLLLCGFMLAGVSFAQAPEDENFAEVASAPGYAAYLSWLARTMRPYMAVGGVLGNVDSCDLCQGAFGLEGALGARYRYLRAEVFYTFSIFETKVIRGAVGESLVIDGIDVQGFGFVSNGEVRQHLVAGAAILTLPVAEYPLHGRGEELVLIAPFVGVGFGHIWQVEETAITIPGNVQTEGRRLSTNVKEESSSLVAIPTVGLEMRASLRGGGSLSFEAGYRYHHTLKDLDKLHLGVVRVRYGF